MIFFYWMIKALGQALGFYFLAKLVQIIIAFIEGSRLSSYFVRIRIKSKGPTEHVSVIRFLTHFTISYTVL